MNSTSSLASLASIVGTRGPLKIEPCRDDDGIRLSLVLPTFNEVKNVAPIVRRLTALLRSILGDAFEIIVVDDDSPDRTWEAAQQLTLANSNLRVLRRQGERGLSSAVIRGWQASRGTVLGVIDADLQHPPEAVLQLWKGIAEGADLAVASRHIEGGGVSDWALSRRVLSRGAQLLGLVLLPSVVGRVSDPMSGYFLVRRASLEGITLNPLGYKILVETLGRGRVRWIAEAPYVFREREHGESKVTRKVYVEYFAHLVRLRLARFPVDRFLRFALVGASGVLVDMLTLFALSDPHMLGWGLTRSKLVAAEAAIINNFLWNDAWTFGDLSRSQERTGAKFVRFIKFQVVCMTGVVINTALLNLQFNYLGMNRYLANGIAIALVTGWNFWLNFKFGWRATTVAEAKETLATEVVAGTEE
jgi:dolichol-phosphate mannosyltransferase